MRIPTINNTKKEILEFITTHPNRFEITYQKNWNKKQLIEVVNQLVELETIDEDKEINRSNLIVFWMSLVGWLFSPVFVTIYFMVTVLVGLINFLVNDIKLTRKINLSIKKSKLIVSKKQVNKTVWGHSSLKQVNELGSYDQIKKVFDEMFKEKSLI